MTINLEIHKSQDLQKCMMGLTHVDFFSLYVRCQPVNNQPQCQSHRAMMMTLFYSFYLFPANYLIRPFFWKWNWSISSAQLSCKEETTIFKDVPSLIQTSLPFRSCTILGISSHLSHLKVWIMLLLSTCLLSSGHCIKDTPHTLWMVRLWSSGMEMGGKVGLNCLMLWHV